MSLITQEIHPTTKSRHCYYVSNTNNHLFEYFTDNETNWIFTDLTHRLSERMPPGNNYLVKLGALCSMTTESSLHLFYIGLHDQQIHEMYRSSGMWYHSILSTVAKAPKGTDNICCFRGSRLQHVFYTSENGHVQELYYVRSAGWRNTNLTLKSVCPLAQSVSCIKKDNSQGAATSVFVLARDGSILILSYTHTSRSWQCENLSIKYKIPPMDIHIPLRCNGISASMTITMVDPAHNIYMIEYTEPTKGIRLENISSKVNLDLPAAAAEGPVAAGSDPAPAIPKLGIVGGPCGFFLETPHIFFSGSDGCVHEIFQKKEDQSWVHYNLTEISNKSNTLNVIKSCVGGPFCFLDHSLNQTLVLSVVDPADGNPIQFYQYSRIPGKSWRLISLSTVALRLSTGAVTLPKLYTKNATGKQAVNNGKQAVNNGKQDADDMEIDKNESVSEKPSTSTPTPKNAKTILVKSECSVCLEKPINVLIMPCKHAATCSSCLKVIIGKSNLCPICRVQITDSIEIFLQ